tara:strand:+ start:25987 stop:26844 length:858 start_codon:yes stop_codon:yes gene_type:complete
MSARFNLKEVRSYYDRHTPEFVTRGQGGPLGAIHRAVWGPGIHNREDAFRYVEHQIGDRLGTLTETNTLSQPHVIDLGCGVGSSLCTLAERLNIRGTGITLSPVQARAAQQHISRLGLSDRIRCIEGDYCNLPKDCDVADLAYAIESFVHTPDPTGFFRQCASQVRTGGLLVVCDDFRAANDSATGQRVVEKFCRGWHINSLMNPTDFRNLAASQGFEHLETVDLTPHLEIGRPRDRLIALGIYLFGWIPTVADRFDYLLGGNALQACLSKGWVRYELAVFQRVG